MRPSIHSICKAFSDLVFPKSCLICGAKLVDQRKILFCDSCRENVSFIKPPYCSKCGKPFLHAAGDNHLCSVCLKSTWHFSKAQGILIYQEPVTKVIHNFKYNRSTSCLSTFSALKNALPELDEISDFDWIIPVPLHMKRLKQRGFNQAQVLASCFFPTEKHKINPHILERTSDTPLQTNLSGKDRRRNLRKAFSIRNGADIKRKKILLVDDVFTTGTTLNECAQTLRKAGAKDVQALTLARVED